MTPDNHNGLRKKTQEKLFCYFCGSRLTEKQIEGRRRLFCSRCNRPIYENPLPATAAVVFNENREILLVQRNVEPKIGQWCLPGGFVELFEEPEKACLRELTEETGLEGEIDYWAGNALSDSPVYKSVIVMGYGVKNVRGQLKAGDDCDNAVFFKPGADMPPIAFRSHLKILENALAGETMRKNARAGTLSLDLSDPGCFGAYVITSGLHTELAKKACGAGARVLQYREKRANRGEMLKIACEIRKITAASNTLFIVNDFIDIALLAGADGVHLGQDDIPIAEARKITPPGFIIGVSTHSLTQALEAEKQGADYIGCGPVFATPTKENYPPIGPDTVKQVIESVHIPVVTIGGLDLDNIPLLRKVGARNFAMVRALQKNTETVIEKINQEII
ncbi:MAG: thiamine phosphate synthase [Candidatus Aminicenantes bacterium]|nr:thiamine phosphate synthase [Candidatus Aminicenantes bacterium]